MKITLNPDGLSHYLVISAENAQDNYNLGRIVERLKCAHYAQSKDETLKEAHVKLPDLITGLLK